MDDKIKSWITFLAKTYVAVVLAVIGGAVAFTAILMAIIFMILNAA